MIKYTKEGTPYGVPPYTESEREQLELQMSGVKSLLRQPRPSVTESEPPHQGPEEQSQP